MVVHSLIRMLRKDSGDVGSIPSPDTSRLEDPGHVNNALKSVLRSADEVRHRRGKYYYYQYWKVNSELMYTFTQMHWASITIAEEAR